MWSANGLLVFSRELDGLHGARPTGLLDTHRCEFHSFHGKRYTEGLLQQPQVNPGKNASELTDTFLLEFGGNQNKGCG